MCARGPWDVVLFFAGDASAVVVEQARRGRVLSIDAHGTTLAPDVASRVVPEMLGAGCSLRALDLSHVDLSGLSMWATWAATFGEAAVCSRELREMRLDGCHLCGALPEMRLPKLAHLSLSRNRGLHCTAGARCQPQPLDGQPRAAQELHASTWARHHPQPLDWHARAALGLCATAGARRAGTLAVRRAKQPHGVRRSRAVHGVAGTRPQP